MKNTSLVPGLLLAGLLAANALRSQPQPDYPTVNTNFMITLEAQKNKEALRSLYEQALNNRNLGLLKNLIAEDYKGPGGLKGPAAFENAIVALIKAFPDIHWTITELIGDGDKVVIKWIWKGTHTGQFQNIAPTGKAITNEGLGIYEFKNDRVVAAQIITDRLDFLQQLGFVPADPVAVANAKKSKASQVSFIDKFVVPEAGLKEFKERMTINRNFIKTLPGFIEDGAYERKDEQGNTIVVTLAIWENEEALKKAKEAVQAEYKKQSFDPAELLKRLNITMDRGSYHPAAEK